MVIVAELDDDVDLEPYMAAPSKQVLDQSLTAAENLMVELATMPLQGAGASIEVAMVYDNDPGLTGLIKWTLDMRHPDTHPDTHGDTTTS